MPTKNISFQKALDEAYAFEKHSGAEIDLVYDAKSKTLTSEHFDISEKITQRYVAVISKTDRRVIEPDEIEIQQTTSLVALSERITAALDGMEDENNETVVDLVYDFKEGKMLSFDAERTHIVKFDLEGAVEKVDEVFESGPKKWGTRWLVANKAAIRVMREAGLDYRKHKLLGGLIANELLEFHERGGKEAEPVPEHLKGAGAFGSPVLK